MNKLGIIGTAGRGSDASKLTPQLYSQMLAQAIKFIQANDIVHLVSGGAAVADHMAVQLSLVLDLPLTLHLPAPFKAGRFVVQNNSSFDPGQISNFYHQQAQKQLNVDSLKDLALAIERTSTQVLVHKGFHARNKYVAQESSHLLAFTFGNKALVKDGGTAHTVEQFLALNKTLAFHVDLNVCPLEIHNNAYTSRTEQGQLNLSDPSPE